MGVLSDIRPTALTEIELFTRRREHALFKQLRDHDPVHASVTPDGDRFYALTRYDHVCAAALDAKTFISGQGTQIKDKRAEGHGAPSVHNADGRIHQELRRAGQGSLRRDMIRARTPRIKAIVEALIDQAPKGRPFDFVEEVAVKIPMVVISEVLGVPEEMQMQLVHWANTMSDVRASDAEQAENRSKLFEYFRTLAELKRRDPSDDVASTLVRANVDGRIMEQDYLDAFFMLLTVAGNETTRFLLAGGLEQLLQSPAQLSWMRNNPAARKGAIEEMLRWVTPVIHMRRTTSCETDLFGTTVPESTKVVLYFASANRDERKFGETAPLFDVARQTNPHVAFGYGAHFCLGAQLARVETQLFWDAFFERISDVRLADGLGERLPSHWFAGLTRLMVEWS